MGVKSWTNDFSTTAYVNIADTQTVICNPSAGSSVTWTPPAVSIAANDSYWSGTKSYTLKRCFLSLSPSEGYQLFSNPTNYVAKGVYSNAVGWTQSRSYTIASLFNSSNPTTKIVSATFYVPADDGFVEAVSPGETFGQSIYPSSRITLTTVNFTLNAPPAFDTTQVSVDTPYIYSGLTTASVTVSNSSAQYGGTVSDIALTIGNQTASRSSDGTLSILLDTVGTFTPTVTVTDSRGQTTTKSLDPITVNGYVAPSVSFSAERTTQAGIPDDEGTYATLDATFTFTDVVATLLAPSVTMTEENGTQTTPTVTWYSTRASDGTLSGTVDWSTMSYGDTAYCLVDGLNTNYSYQISVRPRDDKGTGTAITQTVEGAFYTVDFLAGGHGIAFGKPASNVGFECAMDATFDETLTAQDMTQQEVEDFVDSLDAKGVTVADYIVEQGTDGIWTYRKWNSGVAECWGYTPATSIACTTQWGSAYYSAQRTYNFPTGLFVPYPTINATLFDANGLGWITIVTWSEVSMTIYVSEPTSTTRQMQLCFQIIGRWKNE